MHTSAIYEKIFSPHDEKWMEQFACFSFFLGAQRSNVFSRQNIERDHCSMHDVMPHGRVHTTYPWVTKQGQMIKK